MKKLILLTTASLLSSTAYAGMADDPLLTKTMAEIERFNSDEGAIVEWDLNTWAGIDLQKIWLKSAGELVDGEREEANIELVYSQATSATWDQQMGVRYDFSGDENDSRQWLSYGFIGTAQYFIETDARLFVRDNGDVQFWLEAEKELMLSQKWVLTPEIDLSINGQNSREYGEGSGLSSAEFGLRLGYEFSRKFQPFIGVRHEQSFGETKNIQQNEGESSSESSWMIGLHFWL